MWDFRPFDPASFRMPARKVTRVFLHCTDSDNEQLKGVLLAQEVNRWHLANGWAGIGYHFVVDKLGQAVTARPLELTPAAQLGEVPLVEPAMVHMGNVATIAISTHGSKIFTEAGLAGTRALLAAIVSTYRAAGVELRVQGHCEIDPRPCPVYDYRKVHGLDSAGHMTLDGNPAPHIAVATPPEAWPKLPIIEPHPEPVGGRMLVEGCHGDDVVELQKALGITPADGWFGRQTFGAVVDYQSAHGLDADGIVGPATRKALGRVLGAGL